ncbi:hypothetical protein Fot_36830 [Forsythia ovata]|uniref:Uncharacterized protein n=1 Tax=Forsythia ovata TaxID=205694 RepID=A0ABD1SQJ0_9LAMI
MAAELDDGEFWLPPQFLSDDDLLIGGQNKIHQTKRTDDYSFAFGNSFGPFSDLSSPVESVMGSTETESDEDDYMTELTRKIAQSTIQDSGYPFENKKGWWVSGSPQSTLCSVMGSCGCHPGSGRRSPNCVSKVSSPLDANRKDLTPLELLSAAAEEVARMRMMEETLRDNTHLSFEHLQATQLQQLKEQQMMKQPQQGSRFCGQMKSGYQQMVLNSGRPNGLAMDAWSTVQHPQKQQQPGSGMRALFLGDPGTKNERSGTGVFLPRRFGTPTETRKKSDGYGGGVGNMCSTCCISVLTSSWNAYAMPYCLRIYVPLVKELSPNTRATRKEKHLQLQLTANMAIASIR